MKNDEISLKEAAEYLKLPPRVDSDDPEEAARLKREREVGEASVVLDAMLAASRHGKTLRNP